MGAIDYQSCQSLTGMFFQQAEDLGERPFLWRRADRRWIPLSWRSVADQVVSLARGLRAIGLQAGDRVVLVAENRPEWLIADLAIMAAGGVTVPGYTTNTVADHLHLLNNSGARMAITSTRALTERLLAAALSAEAAPLLISIEPLALAQNPGLTLLLWDEVVRQGEGLDDSPLTAPQRGDLACIIYTSGTGGVPKGVMLSHGAILCNCLGAFELLQSIGLIDETFLSFLPLSHSYEHTAGQFFPMSIGAQIYYAEGVEQLGAHMAEVRPTIMTAVPRLYETMRARILSGVERQGGLKARLFRQAVVLGTKRYETPEALTLLERLFDHVLERLVRRTVAARFGGRLKVLVSGGGPLNYEVGLFFTALGVHLLQGYGQTEAAPVVSCNPPLRIKLRTVGPPLTGVDLRIAEDGEILVRGELVMLGYWGDVDSTHRTIRDGWLHTGDIGLLDEEGFLRITDRKKDIIVNSGGDNISPQRIEGFLTLQPDIAQAMVYGDGRPHLVALLVPNPDRAAAWAAARGKATQLTELIHDPDFRRHIGNMVEAINRTLSPIEKIRRFALAADPFTVENQTMTPSLKIRRHVILDRYRSVLDDLYK